ncbi:MAG: endonuclease [Cytophagaceae bacterium]|nr:endonuclease [Cytophagaceae bacterium]|tara:strand:+ start:11566 stop:12429 length:864 start_codon:yes stop_codon:yes gene_type:complete
MNKSWLLKRIGLTLIAFIAMSPLAKAQKNPEEKLGWKLGSQSYTFNRFTFFEAIDKIKEANLEYVEAFPGQTLGGGIEGKMDFKMDKKKRKAILKKLKEKGVTLVSFGVVNANSPEEWEQLFQFAKAMKIKNIVSEPKQEDIAMISQLCDKYKVNLAIHNHPNPSTYWDPDILLAAIKGKSDRVGACADIGHWVRSGLDPLECLKKLEGHVKEFHFKDLNEKSRDAHDVHWGQGISQVGAVMELMKEQKFKGPFFAEYEYNWDNNVGDVKASAAYFRKKASELAAED